MLNLLRIKKKKYIKHSTLPLNDYDFRGIVNKSLFQVIHGINN